jgi:hypothetical protein
VLELLLDDAAAVGGFETTLTWPEGAFTVLGAEVGELAPDMYILGPVADASSVRIGGFAKVDAGAPGESVVARLHMRPLLSGELSIGLENTQVIRADGAEHRVTGRGVLVDPAAWEPGYVLYLPALQAEADLR